MVSNRRAKERGGGATKPAVWPKHQDLRGGLVDNRERIVLIVTARDNPAGKFNRRIGHVLARRKLIGA